VIDPKTAGEVAAQTLTLGNHLLELLKKAHQKGSPLNIADIVEKIPAEAFGLAKEFSEEIRKLKQTLLDAKVDISKPIGQLQSEVSWWRRKQYKLIRTFNAKVNAISDQLANFFDDVVAIAHCKEAEQEIAESYAAAKEKKDKLRGSIDPDRPVKDVLDELIKQADSFRAELGDMLQRKS